MAWATKKQFAILNNSEEGKNIIEKLGQLSQEQFNNLFQKLIGQSGNVGGQQETTKTKGQEAPKSSEKKTEITIESYLTEKKLKELFEMAFEVLDIDLDEKEQSKLVRARDYVVLTVAKKFKVDRQDGDYKKIFDIVNKYYQAHIVRL